MPDVKGQLLERTEGEEKLIRRLGSAVVLQWAHLPKTAQNRILRQAWSVFDAEPTVVQLKQELEAFIEKNQLPKVPN